MCYPVFSCLFPYFSLTLVYFLLIERVNVSAFSLNMMYYTCKMTNSTFKKGQVQCNIKTNKQAFHSSAKVCTGSNISCVDQSDVFG